MVREGASDDVANEALGLAVGERHGGLVGLQLRSGSTGPEVGERAAAADVRGVLGDGQESAEITFSHHARHQAR